MEYRIGKQNHSPKQDQNQQPDLISEKSSISGTPGMKENSEDIFVEGLSKIDEQDTPGNEQTDTKNIIFNRSVKNDDDSSSGIIRMNHNNNIISKSMKDDEEDSHSNGSLKSKVEEYASAHSGRNGMEEFDPELLNEPDLTNEEDDNEIIRDPVKQQTLFLICLLPRSRW